MCSTTVPGRVAPGELYIGGDGLARGYWNQPELTDERFVTLSVGSDRKQQRLYRTGDQVFWDASGQLRFVGRNDRQIKLRGFRIELDEIESVIESIDRVQRAAVVLQGTDANEHIVAFCQTDLTDESIRAELSSRLPSYMVPRHICSVSRIPQTPAGKTDYKGLPSTSDSSVADLPVAPPEGPMELAIAELWQEVLQSDPVGRDDHFFQVGGNSLQAAQLFSRISDRFQVRVPLRHLYENPTVAGIAQAVMLQQLGAREGSVSDLLDQIEELSNQEAIDSLSKRRT